MVAAWDRTAAPRQTWWNAPNHPAVREQGGGLLGGAAFGDGQRVGAVVVEAERVHAVHHDLAGQFGGQGGQQLAVALVGHRGDDQAGLTGRRPVGHALDTVPELAGRMCGPFGAAGADDHRVAGPGEPEGQAAALIPGAAEDADDQAVHGRRCVLSHGH